MMIEFLIKILSTSCVCFGFYILLIYIWKRRYLYYYAAKTKGPMSFPIIGSTYVFLGGTQKVLQSIIFMSQKYQPLYKVWFGSNLCFFVTKSEDARIILNSCLERVPTYKYLIPAFGNGLLTLPAAEWKIHRKLMSGTFHQQKLNSFIHIFSHHANILTNKLETIVGQGCVDMFPIVTQTTTAMLMETTVGVKFDDKNVHNVILWTSRLSELAILRMANPLLQTDFIWKLTSTYRETKILSGKVYDYISNIIKTKRQQDNKINMHLLKGNIFLDLMLKMSDENSWNDQLSIEECQTILVAGSDATALQICYVLMMLGMHPKIQDRVYEELYSLLSATNKEITIEDLQKLTYLECVIKETLRLFPIASVIGRHLTKDVVLTENRVLPEGSSAYIPIIYMHRDPEIWNEPLTFDPDRFLPSNIANIDSYSYLPFSGGPRNCIGFRYGVLAIKTVLATILTCYKVVDTEYKSVPDIKLKLDVATKCVTGQKVKLEKRN